MPSENALYHKRRTLPKTWSAMLLTGNRHQEGELSAPMLLVMNPEAKHGETARIIPAIEQLLINLPHDSVLTEHAGHAAEIAATRGADYEVVVAAGGDGTVHEVLNGLMSIERDARPALGVIPTGSGNDTRRTLGVPEDLAQAALVLATGVRRRFDVGVCNGVCFNNSFAAGLDAKVTAKAVEYKITTGRSGLWLYLTSLLYVLFNDLVSFPMTITFDDGEPRQMDNLIIAITQGPTYGGGFYITPDADPSDGLFDVCMIDPLSLPQALMRLPFVIFGKHTKMKPVRMSRHSHVLIDCDSPIPAQIDGEVLLDRRYEVTMLPGEVEYIVPRAG